MKRTGIAFISIVLCMMGSLSVYGEFYSYVDEKGQRWFVNSIAAIPERYKKKLGITKEDTIKDKTTYRNLEDMERALEPEKKAEDRTHWKYERKDQKENKNKQVTGRKQVTIYVTSWCGFCNKLESFLKKNNIKYKKVDIEKDSNGKREFKRLGGVGVPLTKVGDRVIRGYSPEQILRAYNS